MPVKTFKFKQFNLLQNDRVFKLGTDGVLLGAWTDANEIERILDIGTGSGLLALMLAQKTKKPIIDAVEVQEESCRIAAANFANSLWANRISLFNLKFQEFVRLTNNRYDLIITNPPFFINSLKSANTEKSISKHAYGLGMEEIIEGVCSLLTPHGRFSIIYPCNEAEIFLKLAFERSLFCIRKLLVKPSPLKKHVRTLMEFGFENSDCAIDEITIENGTRHHYSNEYKNLTGDFYLYFLH